MSTIPGYEVVILKQSNMAVPPICAGCAGRVEVASVLQSGKLRLVLGLCRECQEAHARAQRGGLRLFQIALGAAALVGGLLFVLPSLPEPMFLVAPATFVVGVAALIWPQLRSNLAASRSPWSASPYRSQSTRMKPPTPIALTRVGAYEALFYCASEGFAEEFARLNNFERRQPTKRPGLVGGMPLLAVAATIATLIGILAWSYRWPTVLIDNGTTDTLTIWMDGEPRWKVSPMRGHNEPLAVRISRGDHRFAYQKPNDPAPTPSEPTELPSAGAWLSSWADGFTTYRTIYNPGAAACYYHYQVEYGHRAGNGPLVAEHFPPEEWSLLKVDDLFSAPPATISSKDGNFIRSVLARDALCTAVRRRDCGKAAEKEANECENLDQEEMIACGQRVLSKCARNDEKN